MAIPVWWGIGLGLLGGLCIAGVAGLLEWALGVVRPRYEGFAALTLQDVLQGAVSMPGVTVEQHSKGLIFVRQPLLHLLAVILEEGIFRWLLVGVLGQYVGLPAALAVSGLGFGLVHAPQVRPMRPLFLINAFLISVLLAVLYLYSSFWAAVAMHLGFNIAQWQFWGYPVYGRKVPSLFRVHYQGERRSAVGLEDSPLTALCMGVPVLLALWWLAGA
jgi:membrane protease YdiL (CAAX protease family)